MIVFLASSPTRELTPEHPAPSLDERNGFVEALKTVWKEQARCLLIAAFPHAHGLNDEMTGFYRAAVEHAGLSLSCFDLWDDRRDPFTELREYDVLFLAGGHVPTEMAWFRTIGLKALLEDFQGLVIGTSAGSMNAAEEVYAWPEEPGESEKPLEELFYPGLGLARTVVLPHYQKLKDSTLDGRRLFADITCSHSAGRRFYAIPDGSYVLVKDGQETVYGDAWLVADGQISRYCWEGASRKLP